MSNYNRLAKSFTIEPDLNEYVTSTKGSLSASERVNELLRLAMRAEQSERLEAEAKQFFAPPNQKERAETSAFQSAALRTFRRD